MTLFSVVCRQQRYGGTCCLHLEHRRELFAVKLEAADFSEVLVPRLHTYWTLSPSILGLRLQTLTSVGIVQVAGCLFNDEICVQSGGTKVSYCPACRPAGDNKHVDLADSI